MMADILFPKWTLYAVIPSNPKIQNGNNLPRNLECFPFLKWIQSGFTFFDHHLICCERWWISVTSGPIKSAKFDKVPEMLENDRAWNLTALDKSAFIPIESNSFGKWIAKDQSIISIKNWTSDVGYFFIHRAVVNLVIPIGPSAFHGSIMFHITF